jgi:diguanylate cyclase (GGDEF)-like protein/PAS domain S-box-containing protein
MARLLLLALVIAGLVAGVALVWRARREAAGFRLPWVMLGVCALVNTAWLAQRTAQMFSGDGSDPVSGVSLAFQAAPLVSVPVLVFSLLKLPHPEADRRRRSQSIIDAAVAALAFAILYWQVILPSVTPPGLSNADLSDTESITAMVQAACAVLVSTTCVHVLARARQPGGLPFSSVGPLAGGILSHVVGLALLPLVLVGQGALLETAPGFTLAIVGQLLVIVGASRRSSAPETQRDARRREATAALAPVLPLVLAGGLVFAAIAGNRPVGTVLIVLCVALVVALLVGAVLTRIESLDVVRTLEDRVAERTLDLGTREKWFRALVSNASDVVTVLDREGIVRYQTPSAKRVLGHDPQRMIGQPFSRLLPASEDSVLASAFAQAAASPTSEATVELLVWHSDGHYVETETTVTSLLDDQDVRGLVLTTRDVSERHALQQQLTRQAYSDPLTGLANRALFRQRVEDAVDDAKPGTVAVLFLDLDGFKGVNDAQGHAIGDELLALVGQRLCNAVRPGDLVARLGGDEFGVLVAGEDAEKGAVWVAHRIRRVLANDFRLEGQELSVGASVGIAVNTAGDERADLLLRNADLAMYRAKGLQRQAFVVFEGQMHDAAVARMAAESDLRRAVTRGELALHYQPLVDLGTRQVVGVEALIRWNHPTRGLLGPDAFIELAEETGLVEEIGAWALDEGCRAATRWQQYGVDGAPFRMAVNVSPRQLTQGMPRRVRDALVKSGLTPGALTLEMTETVLMERTDAMVALLKRFKLLGVRLAVDDFGTGYSSLSYLSRFPMDVLKIDRSFVEQVGQESEKAELARTIVHLGRALRLATVAEGIESAEQADLLQGMGCDLGQGFYFSAPLSESALDDYLAGAARVAEPVGSGSPVLAAGPVSTQDEAVAPSAPAATAPSPRRGAANAGAAAVAYGVAAAAPQKPA